MTFNAWNLFYTKFDPIAFSLFGLKVHWYGLCYVFALVFALFIAQFFLKKYPQNFCIDSKDLDSYFIWAEVGVILGARIGYLAIYSDGAYYLLHPWDIFNPFDTQGNFIGIAGFSYHGGVVGFLVATIAFCKLKKLPLFSYLDLATISIPLAYTFGRIGNFLNQELYGRVIEADSVFVFLGILVGEELRYPSQLFEAFFEGIVLFGVMLFVLRFCKKSGQLACVYGIGYSIARFFCEYTREADSQMGYYALGLSMGQILSVVMFVGCVLLFLFRKDSQKIATHQNKKAKKHKK
ncbi:prolipoprotein diacylglyceryl transferase [Helicobacter himalayensis]|uniref:prolipoprotein diacylglyceryl transferase n=1 Tax=Helicobacter himalayensis TaxID=1591088 RepID=UPI003D6FC51D